MSKQIKKKVLIVGFSYFKNEINQDKINYTHTYVSMRLALFQILIDDLLLVYHHQKLEKTEDLGNKLLVSDPMSVLFFCKPSEC